MRSVRGRLTLALAAAGLVVVACPPGAGAEDASGTADAERELAERYAPVMMLVEQDESCGPGEPYQPSDVDALFDNSSVALRGPWTERDLITVGPSAETLGAGLSGYEMDLPPDPLDPGCDYEKMAQQIWPSGSQATVYAHVATQTGYDDRIALQYFFYYPFNDYNNKHESDWEKIQIEFPAANAAVALVTGPDLVVYAQHYGSERADWDAEKLEKVAETHPVVYVSAGSHSSQFGEELTLGRNAQQGLGCDTTLGPLRTVEPVVATIPSDPEAAEAAYPWIGYEGHWGEVGPKRFYEGPTGPNRKQMWTRPFTFSAKARASSAAVPGADLPGESATEFFCSAVAGGSNLFLRFTSNPAPVLGVGGLLLVLIVWLVRRTSWRTTTPFPLRQDRSTGEILTAATSVLRHHPLRFLGIALPPLVLAALSAVLLSPLTPDGPWTRGAGTAAGVLEVLALVLAQAAVARTLLRLDERHDEGPAASPAKSAGLRAGLLLVTLLVWGVLLAGLSVTIYLVPLALVCLVLWLLWIPVVQVEGVRPLRALLRSTRLVRRRLVGLAIVTALFVSVSSLLGGVIATLALLWVPAPFDVINLIPTLVPALVWPLASLIICYAYFSGRARLQAGVDVASG